MNHRKQHAEWYQIDLVHLLWLYHMIYMVLYENTDTKILYECDYSVAHNIHNLIDCLMKISDYIADMIYF